MIQPTKSDHVPINKMKVQEVATHCFHQYQSL